MNNNKSLGFLALSVLLALTLLSFASAAVTINAPSLSVNAKSFTVTVTSNQSETVALTATPITDASGNTITFTPFTTPVLAPTVPTTFTINYNIPTNFVFQTATTYSTTLSALGNVTGAPATTQTLSFENLPADVSACQLKQSNANSADQLSVTIDSTSVTTGFGGADSFYPLDAVEAKVSVENTGANDLRSIVVSWALYDVSTKKILMHDKLSSFSLNSDANTKSLKIDFTLDNPSTFNKNSGPYVLYVWANAADRTTSANTTCSNDADSVDINVDNHFVILNSLQLQGSASCGNTAQITGTLWNIGSSDEDGIYVMVNNADLGISQKINIGSISSLDSKDFSANVDVPGNAQSGKNYLLALTVYDSDGNIYENNNNDQAKFYVNLPITGACTNVLPVTVTASLTSAAKAGQELDVSAVIKNTASTTQTYGVDLSGYSSWASLGSINPQTVTLNAGQSQTVLIKLNVNSDATGSQNFNIVTNQGTITSSQPVSVTIEGTTGTGNGAGLGGLFSGAQGNTYLWVIGALNVLLVLIIIVVAVRVVRKK